MVKKKVVKKTAKRKAVTKKKAAPKRKAATKKKAAPKRKAATKKKAAPKKANKNTGLSSGLDDTFQKWVNQQVAIMNKKKR